MSIQHHPDIASLMCCAAGSQPEAFAAVIASHLACCPCCRKEVRRMQEIGVALFDTLEPAQLSASAPVAAMRACEAEIRADCDTAKTSCAACAGDVPQPLAALIGESLDAVAWRWAAPGIWMFRVPLSKGCGGDLRLFKIAPGKSLPEHDHAGDELTLVLRGGYTDSTGTYRPGDVAELGEGAAHGPVACPQLGCICLTASDGKVRFTGWLPRLLQPILGL